MISIERASKSFRIAKQGESMFENVFSVLKRQHVTINALEDVSFNVEAGEVVGLLGENGAGKSTLIKAITGILKLTDGSISVDGVSVTKDRNKFLKSIGVVFGQRTQLWWELPVIDSYKLNREIYGLGKSELEDTLSLFEGYFDLKEIYNKPVRNLSLGQRVLADLVAALIHKPKLVLLDEPTIGLDVRTKHQVRELIKKINHDLGTTIIITSHDMDDIEEVSNRIVLLNKGKVYYDGCKDSFVSERLGIYEVDLCIPSSQRSAFFEYVNLFEGLALKKHIILSGKCQVLLVCEKGKVEPISLLNRIGENFTIQSISVKNPSLEDVLRMERKSK